MAHLEQRDFVKKIKSIYFTYFNNTRVIEMGSLDINGTVRDFFDAPELYIGIDLAEGPGVDIVAEAQDYRGELGTFDVAISAECFEHNPYWKETFINMYNHVHPGGLIIFTCAGEGRPEHGTTRTTPENSPFTLEWDYYRNLSESDFDEVIKELKFKSYKFEYNLKAQDLYFHGIKE
jgi:SAM-dependent methyltransferase